MTTNTIQFQAVDTLFFRDSMGFDSSGELQGLFPPPMRSLVGAIRTWIGNQQRVDWDDFKNNKNNPLRKVIGSNKEGDLGELAFKGVWVTKSGKRLYPVPLHLLKKEHEDTLYPLKLANKGIKCDLGQSIRLPELPSNKARGAKPLDNTWITEQTLLDILSAKVPKYSDKCFIKLNELAIAESRVGIARDNSKRTVEKSMLYQLQQYRPEHDVAVEVDIEGLPKKMSQIKNSLIRLGGEGRAASVQVSQASSLPIPQLSDDEINTSKGILLYLLTPLKMYDFSQTLPKFTLSEDSNPAFWEGNIHGVSLKLCGAVVGKSIREGGWDLADKKPRTDTNLIPAGSIFFCEVEGKKLSEAMTTLHGKQIGEQQNYGYGQLAVGLWK